MATRSFWELTDEELAGAVSSLIVAQDVADLIGFRLSRLRAFARPNSEAFYRHFKIPKKDGSSRAITAPTRDLLEVQRRLAHMFAALYQPPACVHGFVLERSQITNARVHRRCSWVLNIDLSDFFPSISFGRIRGLLTSRPYEFNQPVATLLAGLCCHLGKLPQGAPSSPVLANMVAAPLDRALMELALQHRCRYTRYADDITFSCGSSRFPAALAVRGLQHSTIISEKLDSTIKSHRFVLNERKTRLQHKSERRSVTGILVGSKLNLPREYIRRTRAMIHAWAKFGQDAAANEFAEKYDLKRRDPENASIFRQSVVGRLSYLAAVKGRGDPVYERLVLRGRREIDDCLDGNAFYSLPLIEDAIVVIEAYPEQGTGFFLEGIGLVTCAHVTKGVAQIHNWARARSKKPAATVAFDEQLDLAILQTTLVSRHQLRAAPAGKVEVGDRIRVLGFPNWNSGRGLSITDSVVFGSYPSPIGYQLFSINHAIFGGNSGGPVLNIRGDVIGVALKGMFQGLNQGKAGSENLFIPISAVFDLAEREGLTQPALGDPRARGPTSP